MKVIFLNNIKNVARIGDIKDVSDGYARNFLIPNKLAKAATDSSIKESELLKKKLEASETNKRQYAEELAKQLEGVEFEMSEDANDDGHLYGAVHAKEIAELLHKKGFKIQEDEINLPEPLKSVGEHDIEIEPFKDIKTKIKLRINRPA